MRKYINCDDANFPENISTDICGITQVKWQLTAIMCCLLLGVQIYMQRHWKYRSYKTLLTFHNLRSALTLLLLAINSLELVRAFLPWPENYINAYNNSNNNSNNISRDLNSSYTQAANNGYSYVREGVIILNGSAPLNLPLSGNDYPQQQQQQQLQNYLQQKEQEQQQQDNNEIIVIVGTSLLLNALLANIFTIALLSYHRVVELKNAIAFLYVSATVEFFIFSLRIYALAEISYDRNFLELEPSLQALSAICLLSLCITDGFTVHRERYRPVYFEDYEKIGYKHTLATFYSKACFWWLTPLLWFGYKEPLELEDLGQLRVEDSARAYYDQFLLTYKKAKLLETGPPPSLWLCYLASSWRMFSLGGLLKLFGDLFALIGPLAIQQIVQYIETMYFSAIHRPQINNNNNNNNSYNIGSNNNYVDSTSMILQGLLSQPMLLNRSMRATGSITNLNPYNNNDSYNSNNHNNNNNYNNDFNEIANDGDGDADYIGADARIYYATWLDLVSNGWAIAWIVLLASLAQGGLSQASTHILNMTGIRIKTSLQGLIYRKTLLLSSSCIYNNNNNKNNNSSNSTSNNDGEHQINNKTNGNNNIEHKPTMTIEQQKGVNVNDDVAAVAGAAEEEKLPQKSTNNRLSSCESTIKSEQQMTKSNNCENNESLEPPQHLKKEPAGNTDNGGGSTDIGAITNLMSEDTMNVMSFFWIAHYVWAIPLKIGVVMYLLYLKLGISAVIGSFVCILTVTPLQFLIGKAMSSNTEVMAKYTDERLRKIHDTFCGIKLIKLNAWDDVFLKKIRSARDQELYYLNKDSVYWTLMTILTHVSSVLITFVTLAFYVRLEDGTNVDTQFTASTLFSALALFQQLTVPLLIFPITVPIIISAVVSTRRIERFLTANEVRKEFQGIRNMARILSKSDASLDMYEGPEGTTKTSETTELITADIHSIIDEPLLMDEKVSTENALNEKLTLRVATIRVAPLAQSEPQTPLLVNETTMAPPVFSIQPPSPMTPPSMISEPFLVSKDLKDTVDCNEYKRKAVLRNTPYVIIRPNRRGSKVTASMNKLLAGMYRDSLLLRMPEGVAVSLRNAHFSWNQRQKGGALYVKEVDIPKARLTFIVGKNGSGKSSLLAAMLMEMPHISGDMIWNKTSTFAYVPQQPWLLNASIRQNILFGENFRPRRYEFVLKACALKPDIELMPDADFTVIGERGINLSGGQRQRVAIARALYSSANVVIMDDPLSSLDNEVARHIFEQSIRQMLLKANRTVIMVTQQLNLVRQADYIIVMKDGNLQAAGSYKDIEEQHPNIVKKWNAIIAKASEKEQQNAMGRTARERWKLFKNVTKIGFQRSISISSATSTLGEGVTTTEIDEDAATENEVLPTNLPSHVPSMQNFSLTRKRSSYYGSRHLIYDVPLPIDECQTDDVIIRRNPKRRRQRTDTTNSCSSSRRSINSSSCNSGDWNRRSSATSNVSNQNIAADGIIIMPSGSGAVDAVEETEDETDNDEIMAAAAPAETASEVKRQQRVHSWQPQTTKSSSTTTAAGTTSTECLHQKLSRNISSPSTLQSGGDYGGRPLEDKYWAAAMAASDSTKEVQDEKREEERNKTMGSFQQFMRRMSARRSNISKGNRLHRPVSASNSILSISEESTSMPSMELSSIATESSSWIENIEDEEPISEANIDYRDTLKHQHQQLRPYANTVTNNEYKMNENTTTNTTTSIILSPKPPATEATAANAATTATDAERKYGKISSQIYLLYLRASGYSIVLTFFITALIWQSLRVYTDVWLRNWTDDNGTLSGGFNDTNAYANQMKSTNIENNGSGSASGSTNAETMIVVVDSLSPEGTALHQQQRYQQHEVTYYFQVYAIISSICILMAMLSTPAGQMAGCNARRNLHDQLLSAIMRKTLHFFQVTPMGRLMNRFSNDMAIIDKKIAATSQRLLQFTLLCLCAILINIMVTPWFILLTVPICVAYYVIQKFYRCSSRELQRIENFTNTPVISHLSETIQGVTTIRAYNQEARFTEILFRRLEANTIAFTILNTSNRWLGISLDYLGGVIVFVAIVTALCAATYSCRNLKLSATFETLKISTDIQPSPSLVGLAINYTLLIPIYLNWVVKLLADMEMYVGSVERIAYYTTELPTAVDDTAKEVLHVAANERNSSDGISLSAATTLDDANTAQENQKTSTPRTQPQHEPHQFKVIDNDDVVAVAAAAAAIDGNAALNDVMVAVDATDKVAVLVDENKQKNADQIERNVVERSASVHRVCNGVIYNTVPISWPQRGDISFENVSLRYEGQQKNVITNLTLKIPAGQKIGICGRTGSGKSSLALSLFGVLKTTGGRILIDNVDITQIHPDEIRSRLSIIPQDVHLFNATIRENLDPPGYYSDLALWNCLEMAQLKEFVNCELPNGLDTEILDGGLNLSSGHRQLFCLARAILRGSVCLVLDEATSSLDSTTELALLNAAHKAFQGRTILTIAHRLSTILNYDRIIVLENGTIVEDGCPQELKTKKDGSIFRTMLHSGRPISLASDTGVFSGNSEQYL